MRKHKDVTGVPKPGLPHERGELVLMKRIWNSKQLIYSLTDQWNKHPVEHILSNPGS